MKTSTKAAAAERPQAAAAGRRRRAASQAAAAVRQAAAGRRKQAAWRTAAAAASAGGRSCIFRKGCVNVKYSGATRARSLCFIRGPTHPIRGATLNLFQKTWVLGSGYWYC